jgi:hypothetical protein
MHIRIHQTHSWLVLLSALLVACQVEKAPQEVDALARYFWLKFDASPEVIADAVDALQLASDGEALLGGKNKNGKLSDLQPEDFEGLPVEHIPDPSKARGFYVLSNMECPLEMAEKVVYSTEQDKLHPGVYDAYERTLTMDLNAYTTRAQDRLSWESAFKVTILGAQYSAQSSQGLRHIAASKKTGGRAFSLSKTWQKRPAVFSGDNALDQDYQVEAFFPASDGTTMHFHAVWRDIRIGAFSIRDELTLSIVVNELVKWDQRLAEVCKTGLP